MERLAQYVDIIEDLAYAVALKAERIWHVLSFLIFMIAAAALQVLGVFVALKAPPLAVAVVALTLVGMLYRAVVANPPGTTAAS